MEQAVLGSCSSGVSVLLFTFLCVVLHADVMPLAWIHDLSRQQLEEFAGQLGLSTDGTRWMT